MLSNRCALRAPLVLLVALLLGACADVGATGDTDADAATNASTAADDAVVGAGQDPTATAEDADQGATEAAAGGDQPTTDAAGVEIAGEPDAKPGITLPGGEPPTELVVVDLVEGDGAEVPAGATVTTHYVGVSWLNDGTQFDASWDRGEPISFPLSGVIPGWTEGIPGMRVGGRRMLIIPPDMAYGDQSPSPDIAPNDTLVFVIDLVDVR